MITAEDALQQTQRMRESWRNEDRKAANADIARAAAEGRTWVRTKTLHDADSLARELRDLGYEVTVRTTDLEISWQNPRRVEKTA